MAAPRFIHLNCRSIFSLCEGLGSIKKIGQTAAKMGMPAVAVADANNLFGAMEMGKYLLGEGVQPIIGITIGLTREEKDDRGNPYRPDHITLLVQNETGWKNIVKLSSIGFLESPENEDPQISMSVLKAHADGLIVLTGNAREGRLARLCRSGNLDGARAYLQELEAAFPTRVYVELQRHNLPEEQEVEADMVDMAYALNLPLVATNEPRFLKKKDADAFEVLMCIGAGTTISDPKRPRYSAEHYFKSEDEMCTLFADLPEATANTVTIAKRCAFKVPTGINHMPEWRWSPEGMTVEDDLRAQAKAGLDKRLEKFVFTADMTAEEKAATRKPYDERLEFELGIIIQMGFPGYFLIVSDFCKWAQGNGIPVGPGRGSGAGSVVAWSMEITGLDPLKYGLFFERFLNPERVSLPDFDIDFCQDRRGEVIDYVRRKFGDAAVAQIITFGSLKAKGCIRDVGRVLEMPFGQVGKIAAFIPQGPPDVPIHKALEDDERLQDVYKTEEDIRFLLDTAMQLEGAYRHCSTHAAGVIIAPRDLQELCPMYKDPRSEIPATQFSMFDAEAAGLVKFDFLGLKTLTVIKTCLDLMRERGTELDIDTIPLDDAPTFKLLGAGNTVGVFQVESQGMRELLKKLQPDVFEDVTALVALYRPGPLGSGMVDTFVECRHGRQKVEYPHAKLEETLKETYGVILYQEQVMQAAQVLAGYTLGGADLMRRAMGKKKPEEMAKQREIFVQGSAEHNQVPAEQANFIFDLIDKFSGYGFNKSHSLAYGYICYQTAYLKTHFPLEFMAASMTLDRGNTEKVLKFKQDLDINGITLLPPDVNASKAMFSVEGDAIRHALCALKGAGEEAMKALEAERTANGPYTDIFDFVARQTPKHMNRRQLEVLIKSGAFDSMEPNRARLMASVDTLLGYMQSVNEEKNSDQIGLFGGAGDDAPALELPPLADRAPWDQLEQLEQEQQAIGFYLSAHPLQAFAEDIAKLGQLDSIAALESMAQNGRTSARVVGIVLAKRELKTKSGKRMGFLTLSDTTGQYEVALFPESYQAAYDLIEQKVPLLMEVRMELQGENVRINAESVSALEQGLSLLQTLHITVSDLAAIDHIKTALEGAEAGRTACKLELPIPSIGRVVMDLGRKITPRRQIVMRLESNPAIQVRVQ
ncbi:MAG: DNA polymerase III subunit alpha [Proteobacteria bacterium]|nr:DNA polymerase III subunit alpha [Pseudomonadota bacterium]